MKFKFIEGDTGSNLVEWVRFLLGRDLKFEHIKVVYPTAPLQPYTPNGGNLSNVWFDRSSISVNAPENGKSLAEIYESLNELLHEEVKLGIPMNRIIVGGFSMGGALAMHAGYHLNTNLGGVFACSSFLNNDSIVYNTLKTNIESGSELPELRMFHGDRDSLVPLKWGQDTFAKLCQVGVKGTFTPLTNTYHELKISELLEIEEWILAKLP